VSRAASDNGVMRLSAQKSFVTAAGQADGYVVSTLDADATQPMESTIYLVRWNDRGLQVSGAWNGLADLTFAEGSKDKNADVIMNALFMYLRGVVEYGPAPGEPTGETANIPFNSADPLEDFSDTLGYIPFVRSACQYVVALICSTGLSSQRSASSASLANGRLAPKATIASTSGPSIERIALIMSCAVSTEYDAGLLPRMWAKRTIS